MSKQTVKFHCGKKIGGCDFLLSLKMVGAALHVHCHARMIFHFSSPCTGRVCINMYSSLH